MNVQQSILRFGGKTVNFIRHFLVKSVGMIQLSQHKLKRLINSDISYSLSHHYIAAPTNFKLPTICREWQIWVDS